MQGINWQKIIVIAIIVVLAIIPVILWIRQFQKSSPRTRKNLIFVFVLGIIISVGITLGIQYLWLKIRGVNFYTEIDYFAKNLAATYSIHSSMGLINTIQTWVQRYIGLLAVVAVVGIIEEIAKLTTLIVIDRNRFQVQSINDALRYSLASALGFAFAENILYFYNVYYYYGNNIGAVFSTIVIRSSLVLAAHLVFSGIAGYYYGLGKFSVPLSKHAHYKGVKYYLGAVLGFSRETWFKYRSLIIGLSIAVFLHAIFNIFAELGKISWNFVIIIAGIFYIIHLLQQRAGRLVLGLKTGQKSTMKSADEEVVLELMGNWINLGRYKEVVEIGDRLLKRDPLNPVIHIFIAEAYQHIELERAKFAVRALFADEEFLEKQSLFEKGKKK